MSSVSSDATNLSLLLRVQSNDSQAWSSLIELYGPLVSHWCRHAGLDHESARDCSQEVFFSVLKAIEQFSPAKHRGSFRSWLWTIARHKIIDMQRRIQHQAAHPAGGSTAMAIVNQLPSFDVPAETENTSELQLNLLLHRGLQQVSSEFEEKTWKAFWRTAIDNVPTAVVAQELGLTTASIRKYRSRVLHRLRQQLGDME